VTPEQDHLRDTPSRVPLARPALGSEELRSVQQVLESGWIMQGPRVREFERRFEAFTGVPHAVATTSCTTALHLAMEILGTGPGDEVIVPAFTWIATANAVEYTGATPRFCDVRLDSFSLDVEQVEGLISERTVGLVAVHLFGLCADMDALRNLASAHGLWLVEDAAGAFGARYQGRQAGSLGDIACFSFHPRKSITTGEGGMLATAQREWATLARSLRDHGASVRDGDGVGGPPPYALPAFERLGYNYRMTDLQGALGCAQIERADWIIERRRECAQRYDSLLSECGWLATPRVPAGDAHAYQAYVCLFQPEEPSLDSVASLEPMRNRIMSDMHAAGIATRPGTHAPAEVAYYSRKYGLEAGRFPASHLAVRLTISLPLYPDMSDGDQDRVCHALMQAFERL
jgi:perosamine synthetase